MPSTNAPLLLRRGRYGVTGRRGRVARTFLCPRPFLVSCHRIGRAFLSLRFVSRSKPCKHRVHAGFMSFEHPRHRFAWNRRIDTKARIPEAKMERGLFKSCVDGFACMCVAVLRPGSLLNRLSGKSVNFRRTAWNKYTNYFILNHRSCQT